MKWFNLEDNVNSLTILGAIAIILLTLVVVGRLFKLMKVKKEGGELSEHNWDGIGEYKNPLPFGWAVVFVLVIIWAIWYFLAGYPLNSYSQIGEYNEEVKAYNDNFQSKFANASSEELRAMGEQVFLLQCASCHGITADGINGKAADLNIWGTEKAIYDVIINGSKGLNYPLGEMPAGLAEAAEAKAIAAFVAKEISAIKKTSNENLVEIGRAAWATCAACHGEDGKGMDGQAPDLTIYGSGAFVVDVLNRGKVGNIGHMPKFAGSGIINPTQEKAVGEYVISLSKGE
ncbi:cbb3-type cytochrome c oxidase N-terminal domain-containing protein [Campylobacter hyointestinalis]|uniref:Cytochrome c oxidase subunit III n=1 Tax=Campylobacter hyointestinalis subsp. lawsonii TaxID=91353 RepID=A0AAV6EH13_CAMHY|nr:cbb3-type cytochrome c oxidase N-terminal domain-containing protein [Campylobacter hyointestinalis]KAB0614391.1 cytochrome C oxidase Cbb3 [Campylobacter hyointestinalis subsp. lawsonii]QKF70146.1 cytochrome c oxidase CcoNOPQ, cbb3-type, membrane-bound monoheme cytochrome c subunit III [Campylobacter hyointestinalis subsp. lawsonii]RAZ27473.1 cytochrome C oxidase Cbb3 [Campylobacter hyointestinalis subsp. lawsonii]RAZ50606.1 cytochrome C oxidase Cbb3 [Campylobacter hyointestinalis subsp. laws